MNLPRGFLLGLIGLAVYQEWADPLPGQSSELSVWPALPVLLLPWLLAAVVSRWLAQAIVIGAAAPWRLRASAIVRQLVVPGVYLWFVHQTGWIERIERAVPGWSLVQTMLLMAPLFAVDWSVQLVEEQTARRLRFLGLWTPPAFGLVRMPMTLLLAAPFLIVATMHGWTTLHPRLEAFFGYTALGGLVGLAAVLGVLAVAMPLLFRWVFPVTTRLPPRVADAIHGTTRQLGFAPRSVLLLDTKHRAVNAAIVGLWRWPRYLVLTDGLVDALDEASLRGVIAHEVGHARARHNLWLVLLLIGPLLFLMHPLELALGGVDPNSTLPWVLLAATVGIGALVIHRVGHRFEFEADQLSAELLGDPLACANALVRVRQILGQGEGRASFRHPSDRARIVSLTRCANDPVYRRGFWQRGARLRRFAVGVFVVSLLLGTWAQFRLWPVDAAVASFVSLDLDRAQLCLEQVDEDSVPSAQRTLVEDLRSELNAALEVAGDEPTNEPEALRKRLIDRGRMVGRRLLVDPQGLSAARPYLALTLFAPVADPVDRTLYRYADAAHDAAPRKELDRLYRHLQRLDAEDLLPDRLSPRALAAARDGGPEGDG